MLASAGDRTRESRADSVSYFNTLRDKMHSLANLVGLERAPLINSVTLKVNLGQDNESSMTSISREPNFEQKITDLSHTKMTSSLASWKS